MNWASWALWGFVATLVLTTLLSACQGLGLTRMSLPYLLGTVFTTERDRARIVGFWFHLFNGWVFSLLYVAGFYSLGRATWWIGAAGGLIHALFVLAVGMPVLPGLHPRMAGEHNGPTIVRQLEPPGFLALNYGPQTPLATIIAHVVFGAILGAFYRM